MKDLIEIRRANLNQLIAEYGQKKLAVMVERSDTLLNSYKSVKVKKNIGEKFARHVESALQLDSGWMDQDHKAKPTMDDLSSLISVATETYMDALVDIQKAQDKGVLDESDKALIEIIAEKYRDRL